MVRVNPKNTDRASYEQNQFNHSLEQIRCAMNKQCDLGRCGWREVDVVSEFPHAPVQPMVLELWLKLGVEPLRFSCGRRMTDVIRVDNSWLLRCAMDTECDFDWGCGWSGRMVGAVGVVGAVGAVGAAGVEAGFGLGLVGLVEWLVGWREAGVVSGLPNAHGFGAMVIIGLLRCATGTECDFDWGGSGESKEHGQSFV